MSRRKKPQQFDIMSRTIKIIYDNNLLDVGQHGSYDHDTGKMYIDPKAHYSTFWHEAVHCILDHLGYEEESKNEQFVEQLGQCICQILQTLK